METATIRATLPYFAGMLAYPHAGLTRAASACVDVIGASDPLAAAMVRDFADYAATTPLARLEEAYTSVFDLDPKCTLYVGYHIFGESYKRSAFLLGLNEHFGAQQYTPAGEVPDHLSVVLRCLADSRDESLDSELVTVAVLPALDKMTGRLKTDEHEDAPENQKLAQIPERPRAPYMAVIEALRRLLDASDLHIVEEQATTAETAGVTGHA